MTEAEKPHDSQKCNKRTATTEASTNGRKEEIRIIEVRLTVTNVLTYVPKLRCGAIKLSANNWANWLEMRNYSLR